MREFSICFVIYSDYYNRSFSGWFLRFPNKKKAWFFSWITICQNQNKKNQRKSRFVFDQKQKTFILLFIDFIYIEYLSFAFFLVQYFFSSFDHDGGQTILKFKDIQCVCGEWKNENSSFFLFEFKMKKPNRKITKSSKKKLI